MYCKTIEMQAICIPKYWFLTVLVVGLLFLNTCSRLSAGTGRGALSPAQQQMLDTSLKVSAAAIETGQPVAAGRLYERLSTSFPSAPEPKLGLAYMALHAGDFATADALFTEASTLTTLPALKAEALLGAGRASLGREDFATAKTHFLAATELAKGTPVESWVINGLAVVAALEGDYPLAEQHYKAALALLPHPLITANLMRTLVEAGRMDEARQLHSSHSDTYWAESDRTELPQLLKNSDRTHPGPTGHPSEEGS